MNQPIIQCFQGLDEEVELARHGERLEPQMFARAWCYRQQACNFIRWLEVFGVHWLIRITNNRFGSSPINPRIFKSPVPLLRNMLSCCRLMVIWLACVMASADDKACALQKAMCKPKIRDNYVYFYQYGKAEAQYAVQSVRFHETSHSITQGQPYEGVFTLGYYLDVRAGRHESEEVAHDFNAGISPDNALGLATSAQEPPLPAELNFAVFGTMSVTIDDATRVCPEMRIAQDHAPVQSASLGRRGHANVENNWWIAGTKCYRQNYGLRCSCGHTNVTFSPGNWEYDFDVQFD